MGSGDGAMMRAVVRVATGAAAVAALLFCIAAGVAQADPPVAEFQGAIRQLAVGATEDAGRISQLRVALGQMEAQRDAALARVKELEAKSLPTEPQTRP